MKAETAGFGAVGEKVIVPGKNAVAKPLGGHLLIRMRLKSVFLHHFIPQRFFVRHDDFQRHLQRGNVSRPK